jgi:hypothetical protein
MNIKKLAVSLLLASIPLFSQNAVESKGIFILENNLFYLDSIKNTFEKNIRLKKEMIYVAFQKKQEHLNDLLCEGL